jgi:hypothetical protein
MMVAIDDVVLEEDIKTLIFGRATFSTMDSAMLVLDHLLKGGPFTPQYWGALPPVRNPFNEEHMDEAVKTLINQAGQDFTPDAPSGDIFLERRKKPKVHYRVEWSRGPYTAISKSSYIVEAKALQHNTQLAEWLSFMLPLLEIHEALFAAFYLDAEWEDHNVLRYKTWRLPDWPNGYNQIGGGGTDLLKELPGIYWGTYFGHFYVDWFGREKFDDLPVVTKQELPGGGIFFTTADTPFEWAKPETQARQAAIKRHLGEDTFFNMGALRSELAKLQQPFPEGFDPVTLAPRARVPEFPFADELKPKEKSREEKITEARRFFESQGFVFRGSEGDVLLFDGKDGSRMQIDLANKQIDHFPAS